MSRLILMREKVFKMSVQRQIDLKGPNHVSLSCVRKMLMQKTFLWVISKVKIKCLLVYMKVSLLPSSAALSSLQCVFVCRRQSHTLFKSLHIHDKEFISLGHIYIQDSQHGTEVSESRPSSLSHPVTVPLQRGSVSATSRPVSSPSAASGSFFIP